MWPGIAAGSSFLFLGFASSALHPCQKQCCAQRGYLGTFMFKKNATKVPHWVPL